MIAYTNPLRIKSGVKSQPLRRFIEVVVVVLACAMCGGNDNSNNAASEAAATEAAAPIEYVECKAADLLKEQKENGKFLFFLFFLALKPKVDTPDKHNRSFHKRVLNCI